MTMPRMVSVALAVVLLRPAMTSAQVPLQAEGGTHPFVSGGVTSNQETWGEFTRHYPSVVPEARMMMFLIGDDTISRSGVSLRWRF